MMKRPPRRLHAGFTLVEAMCSITILATLGSVAAVVLVNAISSFHRATLTAQLHTELSIALDRIDRELRNIDRLTGVGALAPKIDSVTASSITWHTNSSLSVTSGELRLVESGGTARALLTNVTAFSVEAYDESAVQLGASISGAACYPIRRLRVSITVSREGVTETLRTRISLRCCMSGAPIT